MLINIHHDSKREHNRLLLSGIVFLLTLAMLVGLSIAIYQKAFVSSTMITIKADRAGLQLAKFGDVRLNGVLVGQVRKISQDGKEAEILVALEPDAAKQIPANVEVQILPTTLFGQKYLSLVVPNDPSSQAIANDAVVPSSRVETNVELSRILANLFPLLRAVRPADLNFTLSALATALEGRGEQLGVTLDKLGSYLTTLQPHLGTLQTDLVRLADVADTYAGAAPDLLDVLGNLTVTSKTVLQKKQELNVFFSDITGLATVTNRVLSRNEANLIRVGQVNEPIVKLLAVYSPELPCLIKGAARYAPRLAKSFGGNQVKQYIEFGNDQYSAYKADDRPTYGEVGHGPWCAGLPNPPEPIFPASFDQGTDIDENPPSSPIPGTAGRPMAARADSTSMRGMGTGMAGSQADQAVINELLAQTSGGDASSYGALGALIYGPVVRAKEAK